jgi:hypothetical protein
MKKVILLDLVFILIKLSFFIYLFFQLFLNPFLDFSTHILKCALPVIKFSHKNLNNLIYSQFMIFMFFMHKKHKLRIYEIDTLNFLCDEKS